MSLAERMAAEKERLKIKAESRGGFEKVDWFKPKTGDTMIRVLPGTSEEDEYMPFVPVNLHYISKRLKDGRVIQIPARCLVDLGDDCPVCEAHDKAVKTKNKDLAKKLRRKETNLYNILNYAEKKAQPWACPGTVHKTIVDNFGDIPEIFNIEGGRDWKLVKKIVAGKPHPLNIEYELRPAPKDSDIPEKYAAFIEEAVDLKTLYSENLKNEMEEYVGSLDFDCEEEEEVKKAEKAVKSLKRKGFYEDDEEIDPTPSSKAKAKAAALKAKARDEEEEEEEEEEAPAPKSKKFSRARDEEEAPPKKKLKAKAEIEEEEEEEEEEEAPAPKSKKFSREEAPPKKKLKAKAEIEYEDEDVEKEMADLMGSDDEEEDEE